MKLPCSSKTAWDRCFKPRTDKTYYKLDKRFCNLPFEIHAPGNFVCGEGDRIKAQEKKKSVKHHYSFWTYYSMEI